MVENRRRILAAAGILFRHKGIAASIRHQIRAACAAMSKGLQSQIDRIGTSLPELDSTGDVQRSEAGQ